MKITKVNIEIAKTCGLEEFLQMCACCYQECHQIAMYSFSELSLTINQLSNCKFMGQNDSTSTSVNLEFCVSVLKL